jgi:hypothetical protein
MDDVFVSPVSNHVLALLHAVEMQRYFAKRILADNRFIPQRGAGTRATPSSRSALEILLSGPARSL